MLNRDLRLPVECRQCGKKRGHYHFFYHFREMRSGEAAISAKKKLSYLHHKPTGQARVRIDGKDHYLGEYGSKESHERYDDLIAGWLRKNDLSRYTLTLDDLVLLYLDHAIGYYVKDGKTTSEIHDIRGAVRYVVQLFGRTRTCDFGPVKLKKIREAMIKAGWCRKTINAQVHRIRRMFRWGVENEKVPGQGLVEIGAVEALKKGRTEAKGRPPIQPVADDVVTATLPHLSPIVADMVRLQRVTRMRPDEVCSMRTCDIDTTAAVWIPCFGCTPRKLPELLEGALRGADLRALASRVEQKLDKA